MPSFAILRTAKLPSIRAVQSSARHTFREIYTPNADASRTGRNVVMTGPDSAAGIAAAVKARCDLVTENQPRVIPCIEYLITASPGAQALQGRAYFDAALAWLREKHGADNVVSAVLHLDETTPHLAAYVVPLIETAGRTRKRSVSAGKGPDGKMLRKTIEVTEPGSVRLSASTFLDGRAKLSELQDDFAERVGKPHGLARGIKGSRAVHTTVKQFYGLLDADVTEAMGPQLAQFGKAMHRIAREKKQAAERAESEAKLAIANAAEASKKAAEAEKLGDDWRDWIAEILEQLAAALMSSPGPIERALHILNAALRELMKPESPPSSRRFDVHAHSDHGARLLCFERDENGEYLSAESDHETIEAAERAGAQWLEKMRPRGVQEHSPEA